MRMYSFFKVVVLGSVREANIVFRNGERILDKRA
jgi:hypothetical protein